MTVCPDCGEQLPRALLCSRGGRAPTEADLSVVADFALELHRQAGCPGKKENP